MIRKIIHIDMDCFYASVELRENPSLIGKPLAVGGKPENRGVLTTCNYEARKYGLHSAMSSQQAIKKCPNLILLPVNMDLYKSVSVQIHDIFRRYTDIFEPVSLDEAYLDVSFCNKYFNSATWIAQAIRKDIYDELKLSSSAGVSSLKFLAKIASDLNKPNGQFVIPPEDIEDFISDLELRKIPGVGKVTYKKLLSLGFKTCKDIKKANKQVILNKFGKFGQQLINYSNGIDEREVKVNRLRKSIGVENTLLEDIDDIFEAQKILDDLYEKLCFRIKSHCKHTALEDFKKLRIKLKFSDFTQKTLEKTNKGLKKEYFFKLLGEIWDKRQGRKIRLIGISTQIPHKKDTGQLSLWENL